MPNGEIKIIINNSLFSIYFNYNPKRTLFIKKDNKQLF